MSSCEMNCYSKLIHRLKRLLPLLHSANQWQDIAHSMQFIAGITKLYEN